MESPRKPQKPTCVCVCVCVCDPWPQTSHKGQFFEIEIYTSSEIWINKLSIYVWFVRTIFDWDTTIWKSGIWGCKKN